jgi:hypothetical protein
MTAQYLTFRYVPPSRSSFAGIDRLALGELLVFGSSFAGIDRLAPGELLVFEDGEATVRRDWPLDHAA